jgi:hypothetical protein
VRHRAVRKNTHEAGLGLRMLICIVSSEKTGTKANSEVQRLECAIARSEKTHTLTRHEVLLVLHLRAVRKDTHKTARRQVI